MNRTRILATILVFVFSITRLAAGKIDVPPLFADHMVLQRGMAVPVWGTASAGEKITIEFAGQSVSAVADANGKWMAKLAPMKKAGPASMTIRGDKDPALAFNDVLIGDVWICSGQSNMGFQVREANNGRKEAASANNPNIRIFPFEHVIAMDPSKDVKGEWKLATPETVPTFSAVGYFFGREIQRREDVPIGLIANPWGGMPAEAFTSKEALEADPDLKHLVEIKDKARPGAAERKAKYEKELKSWQDKYYAKDPGNKGVSEDFANLDFDDSAWQSMDEPCKWETRGMKIDGAVWFRKTVDIPADWAGKTLTVSLGVLDDFDDAYFNGKHIGSIPYGSIYSWAIARRYDVPADQVKAGKAVIAVRIFDQLGEGGFAGPVDSLAIEVKDSDGKEAISLTGPWKYKVEFSRPEPVNAPPSPKAPFDPAGPSAASNLFNGMVNPIIPYAIKGVIWYQGESNADRARQYRKLFPAMIADWRRRWGEGDFPFLFVQLANFYNFHPNPKEPADSTWAELREAQTMTLSKSPNTGMAVIIDIGDHTDIHPKDKQDVGKRLALVAEKIAYGKNEIEYSGPMYESMKTDGNTIRIKFSHAEGLSAKGGAPRGFQIAGEDKNWHWANATIEGDEAIVSAPGVQKPVAVRYGWADDPDVNLYNAAGLPACPFRTDDWPRSK